MNFFKLNNTFLQLLEMRDVMPTGFRQLVGYFLAHVGL